MGRKIANPPTRRGQKRQTKKGSPLWLQALAGSVSRVASRHTRTQIMSVYLSSFGPTPGATVWFHVLVGPAAPELPVFLDVEDTDL